MSSKFSKKGGFTSIRGADCRNTLAKRLQRPADRLRDLNTKFGLRNYIVTVFRTRWSGNLRGRGQESIIFQEEILPTPLVSDMSSLSEILTPHGLDEFGTIQLSEVSGRYTEDFLMGIDPNGNEPLDTDYVFYEIEFPRCDGRPATKRRFELRNAPNFRPSQFQWYLTLEKIDADRTRAGELQ